MTSSWLESVLALTEDEVKAARAARDYDAGAALESTIPLETAKIPAEQIARQVSQEAHDLVIACEVTSRAVYERKYQAPEWPGLSSGVTIGIGFDVGQHNAEDFETAWKPVLSQKDFDRLAETVGVTGNRARSLVDDLDDIRIDWDTALKVYHGFTVPKFGRMTAHAFPDSLGLHPHSFGSLFSLVYNRGPGLNGERRVHMRNIRGHVLGKRADRVPGEFRAMKSLWTAQFSGLLKRRDAEAKLFELGLVERQREQSGRDAAAQAAAAQVATLAKAATAPQAAAPTGPPPASAAAGPGDAGLLPAQGFESVRRPSAPNAQLEAMMQSDGDGAYHTDVDFSVEGPLGGRAELESPKEWANVAWVENDLNTPEYAHILDADRQLAGCRFELTGRDLELLIKANSYQPMRTAGKIVFSLRGAQLDADASHPDDRLSQVERPALKLIEGKPNHKEFRCTIGVYDLASGLVSGFIASTVPNRSAVVEARQKDGIGSNLLPSGCYVYVVGIHNKKVPSCLREGEVFTVLRNANNYTFDVTDRWHKDFPGDNIHPAASCRYGSAPFSSYGCMVIKGTYRGGEHQGEWSEFRDALGLDGASDGDKYSVVVATGLEAAIAYDLRIKGQDGDPVAVRDRLGRLRHGSQGEYVAKLQQELNRLKPELKLPTDGRFGPDLKVALAALQSEKLGGKADAVYAPATDTLLGIQVMTSPPPTSPTAVVVAALEAARGVRRSNGRLESTAGGRGDLEALYHELGRRARLAERDPTSIHSESLPVLEGWSDDLVALGKRVFLRIERAANRLICGDSEKDQADRALLWGRIDGAIQAAVQARDQQKADEAQATYEPTTDKPTVKDRALTAISTTHGDMAAQASSQLANGLCSSLGVAGPIAAIAAHLIVQQALVPAMQAVGQQATLGHRNFCRYWSANLDTREQELSGKAEA